MTDKMPIDPENPLKNSAFSLIDESMDDDESKGRIRLSNELIILAAAERTFSRSGFKGTTMAQIAEAAALPKANIHYYFGNKQNLYRHVLDSILHEWLTPMDDITPEADPKTALEAYVRHKMRMTFERPDASRLFANELLHGAEVINPLLSTELKNLVETKAAVLDGWIAAGKMKPVDSTHLFFSIWALTQTYADFDTQICAIQGEAAHTPEAHERATNHVLSMIFRACGLE